MHLKHRQQFKTQIGLLSFPERIRTG